VERTSVERTSVERTSVESTSVERTSASWLGREHPWKALDDLATAEPKVLALSARRHEVQPPDEEKWRVYLDPAGHAFCLCWD
jgi:Glyoxalase-like domain